MKFDSIPAFDSAAAWLDLDALDHNIATVNAKLGKTTLRVASKSVRSVNVLRYIAERSPQFGGLMTFDAAESDFLMLHGFTDILCAYPQMSEHEVTQAELTAEETGSTLTWMVDLPEHVSFLDDVGQILNKTIRVCLDINTSSDLPGLYFGTQRSSVLTAQDAAKAVRWIRHANNNIALAGVMGYEAQIAGVPEKSRGKEFLAPAIRGLKWVSRRHVTELMADTVKVITDDEPLDFVNGGGSGSVDYTAPRPEITEVTVGSAYYMPALFSGMDTMAPFKPAAGFVLPVSRRPRSNVVVCHSGGFVASGEAGVDKLPRVIHPRGVEMISQEGFGEVQTPLVLPDNLALSVGDNVWFRHAKAGELCEHFQVLHAFRGDNHVDTFTTYRGDGQCFH